MRPEHLSLFRQPGTPAVHPDGTWAVVPITRVDVDGDSYDTALWRLDLGSGELTQLTFGDSDGSPSISPDGRWLAFTRGGDGVKPQLALMSTGGGDARILTDHVSAVGGRPTFSPDSTKIAYTSRVPEKGRYGTDKDVGPGAEAPRRITDFSYRIDGLGFRLDRPQHVWVIDVPPVGDPTADVPKDDEKGAKDDGAKEAGAKDDATAQERTGAVAATGVAPVQVTTGDLGHYGPVWLNDDEILVRRDVVDRLGATLLRVSASGGEATEVATPGEGPDDVAVGEDGELYLLITDYGDDGLDFIGKSPALYRGRLADGEVADLERLTDPVTESLTGAVFRATPHGVLLTRAHRGTVQLVRWAEGESTVLVQGDREVYEAEPVGSDGAVLIAASGVGTLGDVSLLAAADGSERVLTDLSSRLRAEAGVIEPAELEVQADDGYPVHGWVAVPEGDGPHPVLLLIHGGPYAAYERTFFDEVQTYAGAGYAVVFCNPRGSASYGQEHGRAIINGFGQRDAADILQFLEGALVAHPSLDGSRVGVMGGSYGGYMTAWLTTQDHRWAGAIVERGFLDPVSFTGSSDIGWFFGGRYLGEDPEQVARQSPMAQLHAVTTPTLVIHSEQDWRCPVEQGQRWYVGLKRNGVPTELLLFPGEGHELSRSGNPKHRLARFEHILRWWGEHLPVER